MLVILPLHFSSGQGATKQKEIELGGNLRGWQQKKKRGHESGDGLSDYEMSWMNEVATTWPNQLQG